MANIPKQFEFVGVFGDDIQFKYTTLVFILAQLFCVLLTVLLNFMLVRTIAVYSIIIWTFILLASVCWCAKVFDSAKF